MRMLGAPAQVLVPTVRARVVVRVPALVDLMAAMLVPARAVGRAPALADLTAAMLVPVAPVRVPAVARARVPAVPVVVRAQALTAPVRVPVVVRARVLASHRDSASVAAIVTWSGILTPKPMT